MPRNSKESQAVIQKPTLSVEQAIELAEVPFTTADVVAAFQKLKRPASNQTNGHYLEPPANFLELISSEQLATHLQETLIDPKTEESIYQDLRTAYEDACKVKRARWGMKL